MDLFLATLFIVVCVLLIVIVLLQKGRGGGLGAALGGMTSSAFGTKTGDVFTWVTVVLVALYLLLAIGTNIAYRPPMTRLATPTFQPEGDEIDQEEGIVIRVPNDKGDVRILYTLDGSMPGGSVDERTKQYAKTPVMVHPGETLTAVAYRAGSITSEPRRVTYIKRGTKPKPAPPLTTQTAPASLPSLPALPAEAAGNAAKLPAPAPASASAPAGGAKSSPATKAAE